MDLALPLRVLTVLHHSLGRVDAEMGVDHVDDGSVVVVVGFAIQDSPADDLQMWEEWDGKRAERYFEGVIGLRWID